MTFDQAQSPRLGQRTPVESPGVRLVYLEDLPEVAYRGQIIYNATSDFLMVYDGQAWQAIGDSNGSRLFVSASDPGGLATDGDQWYDTINDYLYVRVEGAWAEPTLPEDSVTEEQLDPESITGKHLIQGSLIVGTTFYTADPDVATTYIKINQDVNGGVIYFIYGAGETYNGFINPQIDAGRPMLHISSGTEDPNSNGSAQLKLYGAYDTGAGKKAELNCRLEITGDLIVNGMNIVSEINSIKARLDALEGP